MLEAMKKKLIESDQPIYNATLPYVPLLSQFKSILKNPVYHIDLY